MLKRERHWNEEAARKLLIKVFEALGPQHVLTQSARKRFAAIWFC
jgi:putative thioredoxin